MARKAKVRRTHRKRFPETEEELEAAIRPLRERLGRVIDARRTAASTAYIGRFFKYNNTYGDGERWFIYAHITHTKHGWPEAVTFQATSRHEIKIETERQMIDLAGWQEIETTEYASAWLRLLRAVEAVGQA